jgi:hypothetical protein
MPCTVTARICGTGLTASRRVLSYTNNDMLQTESHGTVGGTSPAYWGGTGFKYRNVPSFSVVLLGIAATQVEI